MIFKVKFNKYLGCCC